jgi:hypothetical protein
LKRLATDKAKVLGRIPVIVLLCLAKDSAQASKHDVVAATWNDVEQSVRSYLGESAGKLPEHLRLLLRQYADHVSQL